MNTDNSIPAPSSAMRFTPATIIRDNERFVVPLYQRLFAWSDKEVTDLLQDLAFHFERTPDEPYYLGGVTTVSDPQGRHCLVDGQQRLTVLMLMAGHFGHRPKGCQSEEWRAFFDNGERLELFAREDDARCLRELAAGSCSGRHVNLLMQKAHEAIKNFLQTMDEKQQEQFMKRCCNQITLFNAVLPRSYLSEPASLNKYFEVMNSAGVNLEQHEVLKVQLLKDQENPQELLQIWNLCADLSRPLLRKREDVGLQAYAEEYLRLHDLPPHEALARIVSYNALGPAGTTETQFPTIAETETAAQEFDNPFADRRERSVVTFPEFLLLALDISRRQTAGDWLFYNSGKLSERFKEYLPTEKVGDFYRCMLKLRIALDCFVIRRNPDASESPYDLIFRKEERDIANDCLVQFEAMLSVSTPYYKWVRMVLAHLLDRKAGTLHAASLLAALKAWDNEEHPLPATETMTYPQIDRYWFWRLDYSIWERVVAPAETAETVETAETAGEAGGKSALPLLAPELRRAVAAYLFRANRSIEHLHPQDQTHNATWEPADINAFGNLAMISQRFNSQQSNEDVHVKFSRVETQIRNRSLQSLKLLLMYQAAQGNPEGWTAELARQHGDAMINLLREEKERDAACSKA